MRCPKCGYISFDHLEQCLKCKKNIKSTSDTLHGTVFHVDTPSFLQLSSRGEGEQVEDTEFTDNLDMDDEFVDDDLEVLVEDEVSAGGKDEMTVDDLQDEDSGKGRKTLAVSENESEDREIEIDLSQFEDAEELEGVPDPIRTPRDEQTAQPLSLDLPAELADLSDLAPPKQEVQLEKSEPRSSTRKQAASLDMDDLDFDLGLGDLGADLGAGTDPSKETILALDDIDFSETLAKSKEKSSAKKSGMDMDEDLKFDLDLGGLSLHKDL